MEEEYSNETCSRQIGLNEKSKNGKLGTFFGGNIWESNPSGTGLAPHTGFEDQEAHRHLSAPSESIAEIGSFVNHSLWVRNLSLISY